jgi:type II secretory pathway component PulK
VKSLKSIFSAACLFTCSFAFPQPQDGNRLIHEIIDELMLEVDEENLAEDLIETLFDLYENPIEINRATEGQLKELMFLTEGQIINLLKYIDEKGGLVSVFELQLIQDFDERTIQRITPFISVVPCSTSI